MIIHVNHGFWLYFVRWHHGFDYGQISPGLYHGTCNDKEMWGTGKDTVLGGGGESKEDIIKVIPAEMTKFYVLKAIFVPKSFMHNMITAIR